MTSEIGEYIRSLRGPILVMGGSGFVGANLFKMLASHRSDVFAVEQREKSWRLAGVDDAFVLTVDLTDPAATKNLVQSIQPKTVFDCVAYGGYSFEREPSRIYRTNFLALSNVTELLRNDDFSAYVHAGSSSEYGFNCSAPSEDDRAEPNSHYAVSKIAAAYHLRYLGKQCRFPVVNLRLYSVYGPLEDTSRLIPTILRAASKGSFPRLVDERISRDFVYIDDVCRAFILAASKMHPGMYGESYNIGTGHRTTIRDLADVVGRLFRVSALPVFGSMENRDWDLAEWYARPEKSLEELGWEATTTLEDGLRSTYAWVEQLDDESFSTTATKASLKTARSVSAIVACYKDAEAIPIMYDRLKAVFRRLGVEHEIIFVDDCSPDDGARVIRTLSAADPCVVGVSHSRNFGSQMAFRSGMELATKDGVVLLDGDLQDPPELIEAFYAKWNDGNDVVYGRRVKREMPALLESLYRLFYRLFAAFSYVPIPLDAGDFSLLDRRVVGWLLRCEERDLFVRGLRAYIGFKQTGVPYTRPERMFGRSTNNFARNLEWAKRGIFSFSTTPLTMLTTIGILSFVTSLLIAVVEALLRLLVPSIVPKGITTVLITILLFGSFNLFAIGLVGEYVAKIMTEVKGRPRLIRSALIRNGDVAELLPDGKVRT